MMFYRFLSRFSALSLLCAPVPVLAQRTLTIGTGSSVTFWEVAQNIITYLAGAISGIAVAMFVVGALLITVSGVKDDYRQKGKDLMIGAVLSIGVVGGAYAILRVVAFFFT